MIEKEKLINDLKNDLMFEEEAVDKLANYYASLKYDEIVGFETAQKIRADINKLHMDSQKHAQIISELIKYIEGSNKNEF